MEKVGVIVNLANKDMNHASGLAKSIATAGGPVIFK